MPFEPKELYPLRLAGFGEINSDERLMEAINVFSQKIILSFEKKVSGEVLCANFQLDRNLLDRAKNRDDFLLHEVLTMLEAMAQAIRKQNAES